VWTGGNLKIRISRALNGGVGKRGDLGKTEDLEKIRGLGKIRRSGKERGAWNKGKELY